jgi:hypothetical protein
MHEGGKKWLLASALILDVGDGPRFAAGSSNDIERIHKRFGFPEPVTIASRATRDTQGVKAHMREQLRHQTLRNCLVSGQRTRS